jgi:hypothetical protein
MMNIRPYTTIQNFLFHQFHSYFISSVLLTDKYRMSKNKFGILNCCIFITMIHTWMKQKIKWHTLTECPNWATIYDNSTSMQLWLKLAWHYRSGLFMMVQLQLNFDATCCSVEERELLATDHATHSVTSLGGCLLFHSDVWPFHLLHHERWSTAEN